MIHSTIHRLLLALLMAVTAATASAYDFVVDRIYYNISYGKYVEVTYKDSNYNSYSGSVTIPSQVTYDGTTYNVTSIGYRAFRFCSELTSITIPGSVTSIGEDAFYNCTVLSSVNIPNSVTSIGYQAFYGCNGLTSVTIPNSVTEIGNRAFNYCYGLEEIKVENGNVIYDSRDNCNALIKTSTNTLIAGCKNTIITNSITSISDRAFYGCHSLTSINIPSSVTSIGSSAFSGCIGLTSVFIPNSVTSIGSSAFYRCNRLDEIKVGNGNVIYDSRDNCNALIETHTNTLIVGCDNSIIPNSVTSIDNYAFYYCSGLTSVTIPNSVTSIGASAFYYCSGLTSVTIPESVTSIGDSAFRGCTGLTSVTIPESVTTIGNSAFSRCTGLTSVTIPNSVSEIGDRAFENCIGLISVTIPNSVNSIGYRAFYNCTGLTSVTIPESVTTIGNSAFSGCTGLTSVTIPNSVTSIGDYAFDNCSGLIKSAYPEHLSNPFTYGVSIAYPTDGIIESDGTIYDIDKTTLYFVPLDLSSVTIPSTVTSIGDDAFTSCTDLTSVVYNAKNCNVSSGWLSDCANVKTFEIGSGVVSIPSNLCKGLSSIVSITIPSSVKSIGKNAFTDSSIKKVMWLPTTPPTGCESVNATINFVVNDNYTFGNQVKYQYLNSKFTSEGIVYVPVNPSERTCDIIDCTYSSEITTLDIPEKVVYKSIEMTVADMKPCAFMGNTYLQSVTMSYQGDIPDYAFQNCTALESITFSNPSRIGNYAFSGCAGFTEMTIPESVTTIGDYAFSGCTGFTEMTIPKSVTTIGDYAFSGCTGFTSMTIPESVNTIGDYAFSGCTGFTSMTIPKGVTSIGEAVFSGCPDLSTIVFNAANCVVSPNWLSGADNIIFFKLGNDIESIPSYLCSGLTGLTTITIPELVSSIGENAFIGSNIAKVIWLPTTAPSGIENVDAKVNYVLNDTYSLGNQYVYEHLNSMFTVDGTVYVPVDMTENTCDIIDCSYSPKDKSIVITDKVVNEATEMSVLDIKPYSYYNNPYIEEVTISYPGNIGGHAFEGCTALTTATLGDGITAIGSSTFNGCSSLSAINLPGTVTSLSDRVFYGCAALASLTIPNNVTSIGDYALGGCTSLSNITIKHGMDAISLGSNGSSALFADCPLDEVYIGRKLEYTTTADAGYSPFYGNTSLRTVEITDAETQIYDNEFNGCSNLQSVQIGDGVTTIGDQAFTDCWSMQLFTVGKNLESIGKMAFSGCSGLTSLYCHATVPPTCGEQALNDINKFDCSLHVPEESESLYQAAGQWKDFFFIISGINDVNGSSIDDAEPVEYYNLQGIRVENPTSGVYIRRQGSSTTKVSIK